MHVLLERVPVQFESVWELELAVDFFVAEGLIVEHYPLQVEDQHVWHITEELALLNVNLLLASVALIILNDLTFKLLLKTGVETLLVFNLDGEGVARREIVLRLAAGLADHLGDVGATEHILHQVLLTGRLKHVLHSIEEEGEELL